MGLGSEHSRSSHVVVCPFPAQGHVNAALDVACKLVAASPPTLRLSVTYVCTQAYIARLQAEQQAGLIVPPAIRLVALPHAADLSTVDSLDSVSAMVDATESMGGVYGELFDALSAERGPISCIIFDFMLWWMSGLARRRRTPSYIFFPMSAAFFSFLLYEHDLVALGRLPLRPSTTDLSDTSSASMFFQVPGLPSRLHASELPDVAWDPNPVCSFDFPLRTTAHWLDATGLLINTVYELEKHTIDDLRAKAQGSQLDIRAVGPLLPPSFLDEAWGGSTHAGNGEHPCLAWLNAQSPASVLYIAFGSIASPPVAQIQEIAKGLEASRHSFFWVLRRPMDLLHCSDEHFVLPSGFQDRTKERGLVLWDELAPQRSVLTHEAIGGFLTHCGWNSTLESLCTGMPLLCWPMFADQGMNSRFLVDDLGVGTPLRKRESDGLVDHKEVARMIDLILDKDQHGNPLHEQARALKARAAQTKRVVTTAVLETGSSYEHMRGFIQSIGQSSSA